MNDAGAQTGASGIAAFKVNETDINVYTDKYGYAIYVSGVEGEKNYAAVIGVGTQNIYGSGADGCTLLLPDGTIKTVTYRMKSGSASLTSSNVVNNKPSGTEGYSADIVYYRELDNGTYELEVVNGTTAKHEAGFNTAGDIQFVNGKSAFVLSGHSTTAKNKTLYTTSNTIFMVATKDGSSGRIAYNVYTGYNNAPSIDETKVNQSVAYVTNSYYTSQIDVVYLAYESMAGITSVDAFIAKGKDATILTDSTGSYYELAAVVDGEVTTLKVDASITSPVNLKNNANTEGVWPITNVVRDRNDIITSFSVANAFTNGVNGVAGTVSANGVVLGVGASSTAAANPDTLIANATYWAYTDNTKVYAVSKDYKTIDTIDVAGVDTDVNDLVFASVTDGAAGSEKKLKDVFIVAVDNTAAPVTPVTPPTPAGVYAINITDPADVKAVVWAGATAEQKAEIAVLNQIIAAIKADGWTVADGAATKSGTDWTIKATQGAIAQDFKWSVASPAAGADFDNAGLKVNLVTSSGTVEKLVAGNATVADLGTAAQVAKFAKATKTGETDAWKQPTDTLAEGWTYDIGYVSLTIDRGAASYIKAGQAHTAAKPDGKGGTGFEMNLGGTKSYVKYGNAITPDGTQNVELTSEFVKVTVAKTGSHNSSVTTADPSGTITVTDGAGTGYAKKGTEVTIASTGTNGSGVYVKTTGASTNLDGQTEIVTGASSGNKVTAADADLTITIADAAITG